MNSVRKTTLIKIALIKSLRHLGVYTPSPHHSPRLARLDREGTEDHGPLVYLHTIPRALVLKVCVIYFTRMYDGDLFAMDTYQLAASRKVKAPCAIPPTQYRKSSASLPMVQFTKILSPNSLNFAKSMSHAV